MTTTSNPVSRRPGDASALNETLRLLVLSGFRNLRRMSRAAIRERHTSRAIRALEALDDRMLRDIGMVRSEIEHRVRQHKAAQY